MHEYSIVSSLINMCEKYAKENSATKVTKLYVKIGKISGVEPELLKVAFDTFKNESICFDSELVMDIEDVVIKCLDCKTESVIQIKSFECPKCGSENFSIIAGEEMLLMSLEME